MIGFTAVAAWDARQEAPGAAGVPTSSFRRVRKHGRWFLAILLALLGCPAASQAQSGAPNLLTNGDFSAGTSGWTLPAGAAVEAPGYNGGLALRVTNPTPGYSFASQAVAIDGRRLRRIRLEAWMRWSNVVLGANSWEGARMHLTFHDASGAQLGGWPDAGIFSGSSDWRLVQREFDVPTEAMRVVVYLGLQNCSGGVWFDDVRLTDPSQAPPPPGAVNANTPGWFPFTFPGFDATPTAIDLSYLNDKPAGKDGFLRVEGGVLRDGLGRRVRWFGFNVAFGGNFPSKSEAPLVAARLAKMGVNILRLGHVDSGQSLSLINNPLNTGIRPDTLDLLDFFIAELKKQGIYVNLNLHHSRTYPGTPPGYDYSKGLDHFYPPFIAAFKQFTRDLLAHRNPYTGTTYALEPAIACIEVNNENSLGMFSPAQLAGLPEPFAGELKRQWLAWLRAKYSTTDALRAAWGVNDGQIGPNLIANPDFANQAQGWFLENNGGAQSSLGPIPDGTPGIRWTATRTGTADWHLQLNTRGLDLIEGQPYRLQFRVRANAPHPFVASVMLDQDPYSLAGLWNRMDLTTAWQDVSLRFLATGTRPNHIRVNFSAQNQVGVVDLAAVTVQKLSSGGLRPDETFENNNIPLTASSDSQTARRDFVAFLIDTERSYAQEMHRFLQQDLGARQIVYQSQMSFGGMSGALRERRTSDLVDTHGYWQHPQFPGQPWDPVNWLIGNTSQLAEGNGGVLTGMALQRVQGMPFTVSEYNSPAPSDYTAESWPLLAAIAGFQDWDGILLWVYSQDAVFNRDFISNYFNAQGHPAHQAFTPLAALLFRTGMVRPAAQTVLLTATEQRILTDQTNSDMWNSFDRFWGQVGLPRSVALQHRTALNPVAGDAPTQVSFTPTLPASGPIVSDTGEITWDAAQRVMTLNAPGARLLLGKVGGKTFSAGDVRFAVGSLGGNEHAHLGLIALDGQPLATSRRMLLVALGRAENQNMGWNATRTSVGDQWGYPPAVVQGVPATVTMPQGGWTVSALDPTGERQQTVAAGVSAFRIDPTYRTVWYLLQR